jgi:hypothetical protein
MRFLISFGMTFFKKIESGVMMAALPLPLLSYNKTTLSMRAEVRGAAISKNDQNRWRLLNV